MCAFNLFGYYVVPTPNASFNPPYWLSIEIGILAGRLYFHHAEYKPLLAWLGITQEPDSLSSLHNAAFQERDASLAPFCGLSIQQPVKFLLEWLTFRRQTTDFMHSPMGYVCQDKPLQPDHSFFITVTESPELNKKNMSGNRTEDTDDFDGSDNDSELYGLDASVIITE